MKLRTLLLFLMILLFGRDLWAASIVHDFEAGSYHGITVNNATPSVESGARAHSITAFFILPDPMVWVEESVVRL
jgi:hypothetical protein